MNETALSTHEILVRHYMDSLMRHPKQDMRNAAAVGMYEGIVATRDVNYLVQHAAALAEATEHARNTVWTS